VICLIETVHGFFEIPNPKRQRSTKSQIPSTKFQINLKLQISNSKLQTGSKAIVFLFGILNFGHWNLFVIWNLLFGISTLIRPLF